MVVENEELCFGLVRDGLLKSKTHSRFGGELEEFVSGDEPTLVKGHREILVSCVWCQVESIHERLQGFA